MRTLSLAIGQDVCTDPSSRLFGWQLGCPSQRFFVWQRQCHGTALSVCVLWCQER